MMMIDETKFTEEERKEAMEDAIKCVGVIGAISNLYTCNCEQNDDIGRQLDELDKHTINNIYNINLQILELERKNK